MISFNPTKLKTENPQDYSLLKSLEFDLYSPLDFDKVERHAELLAEIIESRVDELVDILLEYESYEVAKDEIARTIDLLRSLKENKEYFRLRVGAVTTFLPRNQPLYAFTCFVIIPSLMANEVYFRIPYSMRAFFPKVLKHLNIFKLFPNVIVSSKERMEFLKDRSALFVNPKTNENRPVTDVVIFTGTSSHADQLRLVFDRKTLFISNGAGHNPIVISDSANLDEGSEAVLTLALYNQGQDCAAPNSILVHQDVYEKFMVNFHNKFSKVKIGPYKNRLCRVGPISNPDDLKNIESLIVDNREWLDKKTGGVIRNAEAIVEPTIICKPLEEGGNFEESFAPVFFIQKYTEDQELRFYFESPQYAPNAMYVTLYGESDYVTKLIGRSINGRVLHHRDTFLHNTHLHAHGIERGTQAYGGYGQGASSVSINGKIIAMPTLPQRDIFEWIVKPLLDKKNVLHKEAHKDFTKLELKNVEKILRLRPVRLGSIDQVKINDNTYIDLDSMRNEGLRYVKIEKNNIYSILMEPNIEYIATLDQEDLKLIRTLRLLLSGKSKVSFGEFTTLFYDIPKKSGATKEDKNIYRSRFYQNIYQLLFKKNSGPKLGQFLWELKEGTVDRLLDV